MVDCILKPMDEKNKEEVFFVYHALVSQIISLYIMGREENTPVENAEKVSRIIKKAWF